jgi:preprotein translocase subunit YajC
MPAFLEIQLIAQSSGPPLPTDPAPDPAAANGATTTPGNPPPTTSPGGLTNEFFMIMLLVLVGMIVFSMMGQRRDRKRREAMISAIKKHDRVQTIGGVIGSVVEVKPDLVVLKVDESSNTRITFARAAIQQVLTVSPGSAPVDEPPIQGS